MQKVISLAKRRGFVFPSSEIYGGLKSTYDFGPLGVELKRNLQAEWWRQMVHVRNDVVGLDAAIFMHPQVWQTSGHVQGFADKLVDCLHCKERFRADRGVPHPPGEVVLYGKNLQGAVAACGYVCPSCGAPTLSGERHFNLMFRTHLGSVDLLKQLQQHLTKLAAQDAASQLASLQTLMQENAVYLRPETAQAMFVQFANVQQSMSLKIPFGIAQVGKSFRNEITVEHFIFRSCEFEQMEMEYFVEPGSQDRYLDYWVNERLHFWQNLANHPNDFRARAVDAADLAHYASACFDIEYRYPWGFGELEGVACRTDYDLRQHHQASGKNLTYFDVQKTDPNTGKMGWRYFPYVIEPAAGLTRAVLVYLLDAYCEEPVQTAGAAGETNEASEANDTSEAPTRVVLRLHPRLAPIKVAVLPLVKKEGMPHLAASWYDKLVAANIVAKLDENHAIGKRYRRHDEIGTPFCLTIDSQSLQDGSLTLRQRDSMQQIRLSQDQVIPWLLTHLKT